MNGKILVDTNIWVYAHLENPEDAKFKQASQIVGNPSGLVVSVQVLNEFVNVARRKFALEWMELTQILADIRRFADVCDLNVDTHDRGLALAQRYQLNIYDAMIAAAALNAG